jgi:hypothetical protein
MKTYIIYEISCLDINITENYIGSTINFKSRKSKHKFSCNNISDASYPLHIYNIIRENGGWENWNMHPIEKIEYETIIEARIREQYWIDLKKSSLNSCNAYISKEDRQQHDKQRGKEYYTKNSIKIIQQHKPYLQNYYTNNVDKIKQHRKDYEAANREIINQKQRERYAKRKTEKLSQIIND